MIHISLPDLSDEAMGYLHRSARIRNISCCRLIERIMRIIVEDQLVLSILDDESKPQPWRGEAKSHYRRQHGNTKTPAP